MPLLARHAPGTRHLAGRSALAGGQAGKQLRAVRAAPRRGRRADARQGPGAVQAARARAVRRADRRVQPRLPECRHRPVVPAGRPAPAQPDPRSDRAAGPASRAAAGRQGQRRQAAHAGRSKSCARSAFPSIAAVSTRATMPLPKACPATCASRRGSTSTNRSRGLMGVLHEVGQAMYDLGLPEAWRDQPVGRDRGMALEESQSLLLEMIIGRSRPFLHWLRPLLEKHFGCTRTGMGSREPVPHADPRAAQRDPRRGRRAHVSGSHHAALRTREADLRRHAARSGTCRMHGAPGSSSGSAAPGDRHRGLPAGRALGHRLLRLFPVVCARLVHRGAALREPAHRERTLRRRRSRRGTSAACSSGCARTCMGGAPASARRNSSRTRPASR